MSDAILKIRMILNKRNGQRNISLPKKKIDKIPALAKFLKIKIEGWE